MTSVVVINYVVKSEFLSKSKVHKSFTHTRLLSSVSSNVSSDFAILGEEGKTQAAKVVKNICVFFANFDLRESL